MRAFIIYGIFLVALLTLPFLVEASRYHVEVTEVIEQTIVNEETSGVALSIAASQHHFDYGTHSWQGSVGVGYFDSEQAISGALAKRFNDVLLNGSIGRESDNTGVGFGVNVRF